jgi:hypothetical protein
LVASESVTTTPVASSGPLFVTLIEKLIVCPIFKIPVVRYQKIKIASYADT